MRREKRRGRETDHDEQNQVTGPFGKRGSPVGEPLPKQT